MTDLVLKNLFDGIVCCMTNGTCGFDNRDGSIGRTVMVRAQQLMNLDRSVGDRTLERSAKSHTPISMFPSQKHHHTTTKIQQYSKHDYRSVEMIDGDGSSEWEFWDGRMGMGADESMGNGVWGWDFRDGSMRIHWDKFTIINCTICGTNIIKFKWTICISLYHVLRLYWTLLNGTISIILDFWDSFHFIVLTALCHHYFDYGLLICLNSLVLFGMLAIYSLSLYAIVSCLVVGIEKNFSCIWKFSQPYIYCSPYRLTKNL